MSARTEALELIRCAEINFQNLANLNPSYILQHPFYKIAMGQLKEGIKKIDEEETIKVIDHEKGKPNPILEQDVAIPLCPSSWAPMMPKCWCEYDRGRRNNYNVSVRDDEGYPNPVWTIKFCPVCGKKMEDK